MSHLAPRSYYIIEMMVMLLLSVVDDVVDFESMWWYELMCSECKVNLWIKDTRLICKEHFRLFNAGTMVM
jgi:hypothetical protein